MNRKETGFTKRSGLAKLVAGVMVCAMLFLTPRPAAAQSEACPNFPTCLGRLTQGVVDQGFRGFGVVMGGVVFPAAELALDMVGAALSIPHMMCVDLGVDDGLCDVADLALIAVPIGGVSRMAVRAKSGRTAMLEGKTEVRARKYYKEGIKKKAATSAPGKKRLASTTAGKGARRRLPAPSRMKAGKSLEAKATGRLLAREQAAKKVRDVARKKAARKKAAERAKARAFAQEKKVLDAEEAVAWDVAITKGATRDAAVLGESQATKRAAVAQTKKADATRTVGIDKQLAKDEARAQGKLGEKRAIALEKEGVRKAEAASQAKYKRAQTTDRAAKPDSWKDKRQKLRAEKRAAALKRQAAEPRAVALKKQGDEQLDIATKRRAREDKVASLKRDEERAADLKRGMLREKTIAMEGQLERGRVAAAKREAAEAPSVALTKEAQEARVVALRKQAKGDEAALRRSGRVANPAPARSKGTKAKSAAAAKAKKVRAKHYSDLRSWEKELLEKKRKGQCYDSCINGLSEIAGEMGATRAMSKRPGPRCYMLKGWAGRGRHGFDQVWQCGRQIVLAEAKGGRAELARTKKWGKQNSEMWVKEHVRMLQESEIKADKILGDNIARASNNKGGLKVEAHYTKVDGSVRKPPKVEKWTD